MTAVQVQLVIVLGNEAPRIRSSERQTHARLVTLRTWTQSQQQAAHTQFHPRMSAVAKTPSPATNVQ
jgi:hypothetical protein